MRIYHDCMQYTVVNLDKNTFFLSNGQKKLFRYLKKMVFYWRNGLRIINFCFVFNDVTRR